MDKLLICLFAFIGITFNGFSQAVDALANIKGYIFYNEQLLFLSYVGKKELIIISPVCGITVFGVIFLFWASSRI